jgi:hypothetical protein
LNGFLDVVTGRYCGDVFWGAQLRRRVKGSMKIRDFNL